MAGFALHGYGQALSIAIRDIYGIGEIKAATLPRINSAIAEANKPGLYKRILKDRMKLDYAVLDDYWHGDPVRPDGEYFVLARKMDWFCSAAKAADIRRMEEVTGTSIPDVKGLKRAVEAAGPEPGRRTGDDQEYAGLQPAAAL